jgi:DNA-binding MarR family transcriptional regulator
MSQNDFNAENHQRVDEIDRTVHSPTRLKILIVLAAVVNADFTFLVNSTGLTRGNLSANLRKLEEVDYVTIEKGYADRVARTLIQLTNEGRSALKTYNKSMRTVLDDLQEHLD